MYYLLQIQEENRTAHQRGLLGEEELLVQKHPVLSKILKEIIIIKKTNNKTKYKSLMLSHSILKIK